MRKREAAARRRAAALRATLAWTAGVGIGGAALFAPPPAPAWARAEKTQTVDALWIVARVRRPHESFTRMLTQVPALRPGDRLLLQVLGPDNRPVPFASRYPYVSGVRFRGMKDTQGFTLIPMLLPRSLPPGGLPDAAFPGYDKKTGEASLTLDDPETLAITITADDTTPFLVFYPAPFDSGRKGSDNNAEEVRKLLDRFRTDPRLAPLLMRDLAGRPSPLVDTPREDADPLFQHAMFLSARMKEAEANRRAYDAKGSAYTSREQAVYKGLGVAPPDTPSAMAWFDSALTALTPQDGVVRPREDLTRQSVAGALSLLPAWYNPYLTGSRLAFQAYGRLAAALPKRREDVNVYSIALAQPAAPLRDLQAHLFAHPESDAPDALSSLAISPVLPDGQSALLWRDKGRDLRNVLVACLGRTEAPRTALMVDTGPAGDTLFVPASGAEAVVPLRGSVPGQKDAATLLMPDQIAAYSSDWHLALRDPSAPGGERRVRLAYDWQSARFRITDPARVPLTPIRATVRARWNHLDPPRDLGPEFSVVRVERNTWRPAAVRRIERLTVGGGEPLLLEAVNRVRPTRVEFRYEGAAETIAASSIDAVDGAFAVRFPLDGRRPGRGRLLIYQPGVPEPDEVDHAADREGNILPVQVFPALPPTIAANFSYYAGDGVLRLKADDLPEPLIPRAIAFPSAGGGEEAVWKRDPDLIDGAAVYRGTPPADAKAGRPLSARLLLADGRRLPLDLRVRPQRPTLAAGPPARTTGARLISPWAEPSGFVLPALPLRLTVSSAPGYAFAAGSSWRLRVGGRTFSAAPVDRIDASVAFVLSPDEQRQLMGETAATVIEQRGAEALESDPLPLGFNVLPLPLGVRLTRENETQYRLTGPGIDALKQVGFRGADGELRMRPLPMPTVVAGGVPTVLFPAPPGASLVFRIERPDIIVDWAGPIQPGPVSTRAEAAPDGGVLVTCRRAPGATEYRLYRHASDASVPATRANLVETVSAGTGADPIRFRTLAAQPNETVFYRVVAASRIEGLEDMEMVSDEVGRFLVPAPAPPPVVAPPPVASPPAAPSAAPSAP